MPRCLRLLSNAFRAPRAPVPVAAARNVNAGVNRLVAQNAATSSTGAASTSSSSIVTSPWATSRLSAQAWNAEGRVVQGSALPSSTIAPTRPSLLPSSLFSPHSSPSSLLRPSSLLTSSILHHQLQPQLQLQLSPPSPFAQQLRFKARGTEYQPSQRVRKRRHGFLARKRTASGRNILVRRREKGRRFLSH